MQTFAKPVTLRDGTPALAAVVKGPDPDWADRIEPMLRHKGEPWIWQNGELLRRELAIEARFYLLHRDGDPFANVLLAETAGVGFLAHVWTDPARRGAGASSLLLDLALEDFRARGGRALFLGTRFGGPPWHLYRRKGFAPIEPQSGCMALYAAGAAAFDREWFGAAAAAIEGLAWPHWPATGPLFAGDFPGRVRFSSGGIVGRRLSENPLLPPLREEGRRRAAGAPPSTLVLRAEGGPAILGMASALAAPAWPDTRMVDIYCHPRWWHRADEMLAALPEEHGRSLAYCDAGFAPKREALEKAGFKGVATLPRWIPLDAAKSGYGDMIVYIK